MKKSGKCPKCEGEVIVKNTLVTSGEYRVGALGLNAVTFGKPEAMIFRDRSEVTIAAWICKGCGYTELYADNPGNLHS